jgi:hypothetical protein
MTEPSRFRKKPVEITAVRWWKNGDHPDDDVDRSGGARATEGAVVRYYRSPTLDGHVICKHCSRSMHDHGWIDTYEGGHIVCPGDWVITGIAGERYPCKPEIFEDTYDRVDD